MAVSTRAILAHEPLTPGKPNFKLETVTVRELNDDELLVRMIATGLCHTDINLGSVPKEIRSYPRVLGHEGMFLSWIVLLGKE
jgi:Zn-dependent alcohol dehydrogenase